MGIDMIWVWTIIIAISLIVEFATMQLISIWLAVGGSFGLVLSVIDGVSIGIQIIVAVAVSVLSILFLRKFAIKFLNKNSEDEKAEILLGRKTKLLSKITPKNAGTLKLNGTVWTATSDEKIEENTEVEIIEILGNRLKVKTVKIKDEKTQEKPAKQQKSKQSTKTKAQPKPAHAKQRVAKEEKQNQAKPKAKQQKSTKQVSTTQKGNSQTKQNQTKPKAKQQKSTKQASTTQKGNSQTKQNQNQKQTKSKNQKENYKKGE